MEDDDDVGASVKAEIIRDTSIGTRSAFFFNESRQTKVPKLYSKESMSSGTF